MPDKLIVDRHFVKRPIVVRLDGRGTLVVVVDEVPPVLGGRVATEYGFDLGRIVVVVVGAVVALFAAHVQAHLLRLCRDLASRFGEWQRRCVFATNGDVVNPWYSW